MDSSAVGNDLNWNNAELEHSGLHYAFLAHPQALDQQTASRAVLLQFQTTPLNSVQAGGTLTGHNQWRTTQPPQVFQSLTQPAADVFGGGTEADTIYNIPLSDNPSASAMG